MERRVRDRMSVFSQNQGLGHIKGKCCSRGRVCIFVLKCSCLLVLPIYFSFTVQEIIHLIEIKITAVIMFFFIVSVLCV